MAEYVAAFAPEQIPEIQYLRVNADQVAHVQRTMNLPDNQANFEVSFLPLGSPKERQSAANEWAAYKQAVGQIEARERGAALVVSSRDESPQAILDIIEDKDVVVTIPFAPWVTHSVVKILKLHPDAKSYDLFRDYFEPDET